MKVSSLRSFSRAFLFAVAPLVGSLQNSAAGDFTPSTSEISVQVRFTTSVAGTNGILNTPLDTRPMNAIDGTTLGFTSLFPNVTTLDTTFPGGTYSVTLEGASAGVFPFTFPTTTPPPVAITNYAALQNVVGTSATITWDALPLNPADSAIVLLTVYNSSNVIVWSSTGLTGASRSATVTGLPADRTLHGVLSYAGFQFTNLSGVAYGVSRGASVRFPIITRSPSDARLFALSCRAQVGTGGDVLIPGLIIGGSGSRQVIVRAKGPAIVGVNGTLARPQLKLHKVGVENPVAQNTGWSSGSQAETDALKAAFAQVGLSELSVGSADCALIATMEAGAAYTAVVSGLNDTTGVALVEVYELGSASARMSALSCRARVGTGDDVLIPGIVLAGGQNKLMMIRASGPALAAQGVGGTLAQPRLQLYNSSGVLMAENTGWSTAANKDEIFAVSPRCGLTNFPTDSADCAILTSLPPGGYTAHVSGVGGTTGVALIEVYEVP